MLRNNVLKFLFITSAFIGCLSAFALDKKGSAKGALQKTNSPFIEAAIQKAKNLTLQQDRSQVTQILIRVYSQPGLTIEDKNKLIKNLDLVSGIFYKEETQKYYQLGVSLQSMDNNSAIERLLEARKLEPGNVVVLKTLGQNYRKIKKDNDALEIANEALIYNPLDSEIILLKLQSLVSLKKSEEFKETLDSLDSRTMGAFGANNIYLDILKIENFYNNKQFEDALVGVQKIKNLDPAFAETYLWLGQIYSQLKKEVYEPWSKYVDLCGHADEKTKKRYALEPRFCLEYKNVEIKIKEIEGNKTKNAN